MGWFTTMLKMLVTDDTRPQAKKSQLAKGRHDGRQIVRPGSYIRIIEGEGRGEDAAVQEILVNGQIIAVLQRNGKMVRTWEHKVQALKGPTRGNQSSAQRGQKCRINRGPYRGRLGVIADKNTSGDVWVKITAGSDDGRDPTRDVGREVKVGSNDITLLGR